MRDKQAEKEKEGMSKIKKFPFYEKIMQCEVLYWDNVITVNLSNQTYLLCF